MGYISKGIAVKMASKMDNGNKFDCCVHSLTGGSEKNFGLNIKVSERAYLEENTVDFILAIR